MAYKGKDSCYNNAAPDEPIFVLRAQDLLAPAVVRFWANAAHMAGVNKEKIEEAAMCAEAMEEWAKKKQAKVPD